MRLKSFAKTIGTITITASMLASTALAKDVEKYKLDAAHSNLGFKVRHLGISNVKGNFKKFSGSAEYNQKTKAITNLAVSIDASSIYTNEPDRDKHLRSEDFFNVKKFKTITFKAEKFKYQKKILTEMIGKITIKGKTLPLTLKVTDWGGFATDPWDNQRVAFEAEGKIDRTKFGLNWNKGLKKAAGLFVGNKVTILIEAQGIKVD